MTSTQYPWHLSDAPASAYPPGHQPPSSEVGAQGYGGTSHSWEDQHGAWYGGLMNGWVFAKGDDHDRRAALRHRSHAHSTIALGSWTTGKFIERARKHLALAS